MRSSFLKAAAAAVVGVLACAGGVVAMPTEHRHQQKEVVASSRTQAVIKMDQAFIALREKEAAASANVTLAHSVQSTNAALHYDYDTATQLFWHSVTAYCIDNSNLDDWSCASCNQFGPFTVTGVMDDTTNQGYVGYFTQGLPASPIPGVVGAKDPFVIVSFRGTVPSDLSDWIEDLSFSKFSAFSSKYPAVSVHDGFWSSYQSLKKTMMPALKEALVASNAKTIIVTGHSLGAAMAELAAIDLKINEYPNLHYASYTQGTPRVGDAAFASLYPTLVDVSFREIHYRDVVPHLPPMLLGFDHAQMEIWFDEAFDPTPAYCSGTPIGEDSTCSDRSLLFPISIDDHTHYRGISVGGYCSAMNAKAAAAKKATVVAPAAAPATHAKKPHLRSRRPIKL